MIDNKSAKLALGPILDEFAANESGLPRRIFFATRFMLKLVGEDDSLFNRSIEMVNDDTFVCRDDSKESIRKMSDRCWGTQREKGFPY